MEFLDFYLPFGGRLDKGNRWAKLAELIPWETIEEHYQMRLADTGMGAPAKSGRIAFGALIIKERLAITDEETVEQIKENPYLQYFLGLSEYRGEALFDPSTMVHFRSRFNQEDFTAINDEIVARATGRRQTSDTGSEPESDADSPEQPSEPEPDAGSSGQGVEQDEDAEPRKGKLIIDATCAPADVTYPTDLKLLGEAREKTEKIIDLLHAPLKGRVKKPRTYRRQARKRFLAIAKAKKPGAKKRRKAIGQQLGYLRRNLGHVDALLERGASLSQLDAYDYKCLLVIHTLHEQQLEMHERRKRRVDDRIVSISQPHVRPIIRGKAGRPVEFGAKLSASCADGFVHLERLGWDSFNEGGDLQMQVERYRRRHGHYPQSVHADKIYRTLANRKYCKKKRIRLSGPPLGRPRKPTAENRDELEALKRQAYEDEVARIPIEGKFGNCKRKGTLARVMAKLNHTSESVINIAFIALNLDTALRGLLFRLYSQLWPELRQAFDALMAGVERNLKFGYWYSAVPFFSIRS